jgi:hypothetical protein
VAKLDIGGSSVDINLEDTRPYNTPLGNLVESGIRHAVVVIHYNGWLARLELGRQLLVEYGRRAVLCNASAFGDFDMLD